jgi:oligopeptidase A
MQNPLLTMQGLPPFSQIQPEQVVPAITQRLNDNRTAIATLLQTAQPPTWDNLIHPLNELNDQLNRTWSPIGHLHGVADTEALREPYNQCLAMLSDYRTEIGQNQQMYAAYQEIANSAAFSQLTPAQQRIIHNELRDFRLSGIQLPQQQQERCKTIYQRLSQLGSQFSEHVLDATHGWKKHVTDETLLSGLPNSVKALAQQNAQQENLAGWLLTLDFPCYQPVLNYADNRELRQEMYEAFVTRASDQGVNAGKWDNAPIIQEILTLRQELATLLGFNNYAEFSLYTKMADTPQQVIDFLMDLATRARPYAERDLQELHRFVQQQFGITNLAMWDVAYYSEKLRLHDYDISQETLRPYFPLPKVLAGLFVVIQRLFNMSIQAHPGVEVWHPEVQFFDIFDDTGQLRGQFYLDLYARKGKRGGAWMDDCITRKKTAAGVQIPVAYLVCNFTPPVDKQSSLLTHYEVTTLFHEFGHGLHHLLTLVDDAPVAGINGVLWDAVELPSQMLENWCWEQQALAEMSAHVETGEPLPETLFAKLRAAKNFQSGLFLLRQLEFAVFDMRVHTEYSANMDVQALLDQVRQQISVLIPPSYNRFQQSFSHIFAGGYAAGYYSYKWAEVLAADAFAKFEETGIFNQETGKAFLQCILEQGGACAPMELFIAFRGREPQIDALLRHCGMNA